MQENSGSEKGTENAQGVRGPASDEARGGAVQGRVLVVDDEPMIQRAIARCLPNYEVLCASTGSEAVHLALSQDFAVILCDLYMPGMDGPQLYATLRNAKPHQAERMIIVTGGATTGAMERFLEQTHLPVLNKPFRPAQLRALLEPYFAPPAWQASACG